MEISQYATDQLGVELNKAAATALKSNIAITSRSYSHLSDADRESIKKFIKANPDAKGKDISQYATDQLGVELNKEAANALKRRTITSQSYAHLTDADRESIKKFIKANPDVKGKEISQYATDQLGVELNKEAATALKRNITHMMITKK